MEKMHHSVPLGGLRMPGGSVVRFSRDKFSASGHGMACQGERVSFSGCVRHPALKRRYGCLSERNREAVRCAAYDNGHKRPILQAIVTGLLQYCTLVRKDAVFPRTTGRDILRICRYSASCRSIHGLSEEDHAATVPFPRR